MICFGLLIDNDGHAIVQRMPENIPLDKQVELAKDMAKFLANHSNNTHGCIVVELSNVGEGIQHVSLGKIKPLAIFPPTPSGD